MTVKHGNDIATWPVIGCRSKFRPWAKGASMVVELKQEDGSWLAMMAERLPVELDDEIKKYHFEFYER